MDERSESRNPEELSTAEILKTPLDERELWAVRKADQEEGGNTLLRAEQLRWFVPRLLATIGALRVERERLQRRLQRILDDRYESYKWDQETFEAWGLATVWGPDFTEEAPSMRCLCGHRTKDHVAHHVGGTPTYFRGECGSEGCKCRKCRTTTATREIARRDALELRDWLTRAGFLAAPSGESCST